jgi:hypothetical protein
LIEFFGSKGAREGGREGGREGVREGMREGVREGEQGEGRVGKRERGREGGREGGRAYLEDDPGRLPDFSGEGMVDKGVQYGDIEARTTLTRGRKDARKGCDG